MKSFKSWVVGALALWVSAATLAAPVDIAGVKVEDSATVAGTKLQLNGAGIRYKGPFKVYNRKSTRLNSRRVLFRL